MIGKQIKKVKVSIQVSIQIGSLARDEQRKRNGLALEILEKRRQKRLRITVSDRTK